ncbi:Cytochrome P450 monooxygenase astJ [Paramyrothecium foliicola]|nr:Cytochrome P450 monooxygenase astJ [Paramyrothecium foliicola]
MELADIKMSLHDLWAQSSTTTLLAAATGLSLMSMSIVVIYRLWFHPLAQLPGPKAMAATGWVVQWQNNILGTFVRKTVGLHRQYGPVVRIGPNHVALDGSIGWPEVFGHKSGRPEFGKVKDFFGHDATDSIIGAERESHRRQRRQLAHAFSEAALVEQQGIILEYIDLFMTRLSEAASAGKQVNIVDLLNFLTFDIIGDLTFGESFGSLKRNGYHPWVRFIVEGVRAGAGVRLAIWYPWIKPLLPAILGKRFVELATANNELSKTKAAARIEQGEQEHRRDFMTYMTRKSKEGNEVLTPHEQLINSPLLIGAGSETTATALSGFYFYMGHDPKLIRTLTSEVRGAFKEESEIDMKSAARLVYLHACLEEALRMYPPAAETPPRVSPGLEVDNVFIPAGTVVSIYQFATFRNPDNFADPNSFRPERWLPKTHELYDPIFDQDNKNVFKPFSFGPRDCIGKNLAYAEMRVIVARMLYRFDVEIGAGQEGWHDKQRIFLVWQKDPLYLDLKHAKHIAT